MRELEGQRQSLRQPTAAAACRDLALARGSQFGDQVCLLKRADGSEHLPHQHCCRAVGREEVGTLVGTSSTPSERR